MGTFGVDGGMLTIIWDLCNYFGSGLGREYVVWNYLLRWGGWGSCICLRLNLLFWHRC